MAERHVAIVLAGGKGSRMNSDVPKQYLEIKGRPILYYSLKAFQDSFIDEIILVTGAGEEEYCRREIVEKYDITKVSHIVCGGAQRYDSVYQGIRAVDHADYIYIHDGARPFIDGEILERGRTSVQKYGTAVAGMPVKDTIKIVDADAYVKDTPQRQFVWQIQTPQIFEANLIRTAYERLYDLPDRSGITDDAMVVETIMKQPVRLFEASYMNMKVTTPEDLLIADCFLNV